ncbi:MAG TPA: glycine zipper 2TM domain-containing protein [Candidatus Polarisedimenticolaceae bacterium]|nr:glycine zipper 2TM domain-containing protein [Candidatus Polarisedimenticolaceae bacterium]
MSLRTGRSLILTVALAAVALFACGGSKPVDQAAAPAASSAPPPSSAPAPDATTTAPAAEPAPPPPAAPPQPQPAPRKPAPKPAAQPSPSPAPVKPEPAPAPVVTTLATGTDIEVELLDAASSKTSQVGDSVRARVTKDVVGDGRVVVPAGSVVNGTVTEAVPLKTIGGAASLGLRFDTIDLADGAVPISASLHQKGKSETGKDAGTIAGAAAGGALLGRLLSKHDKTKGTVIGAAVGAAAGTGAAAATKGKEVEIPAGTQLALKLEQPIQVTTRL